MTWLQVLTLACTIATAIIYAGWAVFRPLIAQLIKAMVVEPLALLRTEIREMHAVHGAQIRKQELEHTKLKTTLEVKKCLEINNQPCSGSR